MLEVIVEGRSPLLALAANIASWLLLLALGLCFYRLARGPSLADRVVALDVLNILAVAYCALLAIASGRAVYLDAAIALALVAFLVTVAFAHFVERSVLREQPETDRGKNDVDH
ncbi:MULTISPECIES: monovalent cation/H+ antiporter complex subunit F [Microbulbifer]|uniref:monovalent cation/H+ antiporter complex subunit F n=1 Tax=Microbulbifer TaxID=48073 RepID=UPI001E2D7AC4|nr:MULTISPECIES: cation:proton antiporter [Microbulbifer]UHQ56239.1 cation:proton antiporter [Microbulbifer sp. YPW16]